LVYIIWTDEALGDLGKIKDYLLRVADERTARTFCLALLAAPDRLRQFPRSGQVVPEFQIEAIREVLHRDYRIIYQVVEGACYVRAIVHGSRDLQRHVDPASWKLN
jgi:plasmid stabilization system protein ParE